MQKNCNKIGILTTWNQECGLSTFARFLLSQYPEGEVVIFAETSKARNSRTDEEWVRRCWSLKEPNDLNALQKEIEISGIRVLHINCQNGKFFSYPVFSNFLDKLRTDGIKILSHVHSIFTWDASNEELFKNSDLIVTHCEATRLEVISHGIDPQRVRVIPHGVESSNTENVQAVKAELGLPKDKKILLTCGFMQPHKGMEAVIEAVALLKAKGISAHAVLVGSIMSEDPGSRPYCEALKQYAFDMGVLGETTFVTGFVSDEALLSYMGISDLIMLNYKSTYFESSGIGALAVGSGKPVITSLAPAFIPFGNSVFRMTSGFTPGLAAELILTNDLLRTEIVKNAKNYSAECAWSEIAKIIHEFYGELSPQTSSAVKVNTEKHEGKAMRVLMQNRGNMFSHPGGDTTLVTRLSEGLKKKGVEVVVDNTGNEDPAKFDLVHLFNFALPQMVQALGQRATAAGKPFVVSTLAEDIPSFHTQSHALAATLMDYQNGGQVRNFWNEHAYDWNGAVHCKKFENEWAVKNAKALFVNGAREGWVISRDYPGANNIVEVKLGYETSDPQSADLFVKEYGVKDFVFSVGRIETRKNQLMLLKALEDSDIPVVFAAGGFSYQQDYERAVRNFKRKGKTIILDRLSPEMLASAYAASKIHALPSWYELPGLVTLEAAAAGKNVVATRSGTMPDYLGDLAFYCHPGDKDSIYNALMAAYYAPVAPELAAKAKSFSWDSTIAQTLSEYEKIVGRQQKTASTQNIFIQPIFDLTGSASEFQEALEKGELAAKNIDFESAHKHLTRAEALNGNSARVLKARGATFLAEGKVSQAREYFERAIKIAPDDEKVVSGRGMCEMLSKEFENAIPYFQKALKANPEHSVSLYQLVECFMESKRTREAEFALKDYLARKGDDLEAKALYAKCLLSLGKRTDAKTEANQILAVKPDHAEAREILEKADAKNDSTVNVKWALRTDEETKAIEVEEFKRRREFAKAHEMLKSLRDTGFVSSAMKARLSAIEGELVALDSDDFAKAEEIFDSVLKEMPEYPRALCGKGALAAEGHRLGEAKGYFERALKAEAEHDIALAGLAVCELSQNNNDAAWGYFKRALKKNPENQRAVLGVVQLGYPRKDYPAIENAIRSFLEYHPVSLDMQYALAGVLYAQQRSNEAKVELEKILIFEPENERALELKGMIEKLAMQKTEARSMAQG